MKQLIFAVTIRVPDQADDMDALNDLAEHLDCGYGWVMIQRDNRTVVRNRDAAEQMYGREVWDR